MSGYAGGAHSAPPDTLTEYRDPTSKGRDKEERVKG